MAGETRKLTLRSSSQALLTLNEIWLWTAQNFGAAQADRYTTFLLDETERIGTFFLSGKPVPNKPRLRYMIIRKRRKGHGHLAVYEVVGQVIHVLQFYHTAQNWQTKLSDGFG